MPSATGATIKAEMSVAVENIQFSIHSARQMARVNEAAVSMNLSGGGESEAGQSISFTGEDGEESRSVQIQNFSMPAEIMLLADHDSFVFDSRGLVENPGTIVLVSKVDESITSSISVK